MSRQVCPIDRRPPLGSLIALAFQYVGTMGIPFVPIILAQLLGLSAPVAAGLVSWTMVGVAIATVLTHTKPSFITAGQPVFIVSHVLYVAPTVLAYKVAGMAGIYGMTVASGVVQMVIAPFLGRMRALVNADVGITLVGLVGFGVGYLGVEWTLAPFTTTGPCSPWISLAYTVGVLTLLYLLKGLGSGLVRSTAILIALVVGYLSFAFTPCFGQESREAIQAASWVSLPHIATGGYALDTLSWVLVIVCGLVSSLTVIGVTTLIQKFTDPNWSRPDMRSLASVNMGCGLATCISGLLGGTGLSASSSGAAMTISSGIASRWVGYLFALTTFAIAFCPKVATLLIYIPQPVIAAVLVYLGASVVMGALTYLTPRFNETRIALTATIPLFLGIGRELFPTVYTNIPGFATQIASSSLAVAAAMAIALNFFFHMRLEFNRRTFLVYDDSEEELDHMRQFVGHYGEKWDVVPRSLERALDSLTQLAQQVGGRVRLEFAVDEIGLHMVARYRGDRLDARTANDLGVVDSQALEDGRQQLEIRT